MNITFDLENKKQIQSIISKISSTENVDKIKPLVKELQSLTKGYPCCKICGEPLYYQLMVFKIVGGNKLQILTPKCFEHEYNSVKYKLDKCYGCIKEHFGDDMPSMQRYLFQIRYRWARWIYEIPEDIHEKIRSDKCGVTLESLIRKWGKEDGEKRWKEYCRKQGEVNTFEYKQKKFGWTKEQFDEFNKSRACTIENFIDRYGEETGKEKWQSYLNKQHETKSWEYMVEKFGEERAREINAQKVLNLETFVRKYGEKLGEVKFRNYIECTHFGYSKVSQKLFKDIDLIINKNNKYHIYYALNNSGEFKLSRTKHTYLLDFYIPELKICIEFDGDLWHANPSKYKAEDRPCPYSEATAKEIWEKDKIRQDFIESQGIKVVRIWESEYTSKDFDIHKFIKERMGIELNNENN